MTVFDGYARYYNLLYRDKDYAAEARHVHEMIQKHRPGASTLMEMGCGTGRHARHLAQFGYRIHGVDRSRSMLEQAVQKIQLADASSADHLRFSQGDIRDVRLNEHFDAVLALFHVISYLPTMEDIEKTFCTACRHLEPGGVLLFDCWYGPAVLSFRPAVRVKRMKDDSTEVVRIAEPILRENENLVDVCYEVMVRDRPSGRVEMLRETHRMRYLFMPEVEQSMKRVGLKLLESFEWMTGRPPGCDTWGVCFVGQS